MSRIGHNTKSNVFAIERKEPKTQRQRLYSTYVSNKYHVRFPIPIFIIETSGSNNRENYGKAKNENDQSAPDGEATLSTTTSVEHFTLHYKQQRHW